MNVLYDDGENAYEAEDIDDLIKENIELKAKVAALEAKIEELENKDMDLST